MKAMKLLGCVMVLVWGVAFGYWVLVQAAPVELSFWIFINPEGTDPRASVLRQIVDDFNASHPDIHVVVQYVHWREIDNRIIQATAVGKGPDIFDFYLPNLSLHVEAGTLLPLDPEYVSAWSSQNSDYIFSLDDLVQADGHIWGLPWETRVWLLWYRSDYLQEIGLQVPQTLDELITTAAALTSPTRIGFAYGLSETALAAEFIEKYQMLIRAAGGTLFDKDLRPLVNTEPGIKAMEWIQKLFVAGGATLACVNMNADDVLNGVGAGTIAMACEGSMRVATARSLLGEKGAFLKTAAFPSFDPGVPAPALMAVRYIGIGAGCKNVDAAWTFITYWLEEGPQKLWATVAGILPVRQSVLKDPFFNETETGREMAQWVDLAAKHGFLERYPSDFSYFSELMVRAAQQIILNNAPVKETLDNVVATYLASQKK